MENKRDAKYDDHDNLDDKTRKRYGAKSSKFLIQLFTRQHWSLLHGMFVLHVSGCSFYSYYALLRVVETSLF